MRKILCLCSLMVLILFGCAPKPQPLPEKKYELATYDVDSSSSKYTDKHFSISISPSKLPSGYINGFILRVENKTSDDIIIDWSKTYFLNNGSADGGFMFEGIRYIDRDSPKQPWLIMANSTSEKAIFPNSLVISTGGIPGLPWHNKSFRDGEYGVYSIVKVGEKEKKVKVTLTIVKTN